jgi:predicted transcriptional regulator
MTKLRELFRRNASDTSIEAAISLDVTKLEGLVLQAIRSAGPNGMTQTELLAQFPGFSYSSITARPSALKRKGLIKDSGRRRPSVAGRSQAVLVAVTE